MEGDRGGPRWTDMDGGRERMNSPNWNALGGGAGGGEKDAEVFVLFLQLSYKTEMTAEVEKLLLKGSGKTLIRQAKKLQMRLRVLLEVAWVTGRKARSRDRLRPLFGSHSILPVQRLSPTREMFKTFESTEAEVTWVTA